jgi:hypothetical protein
MFADTENVGKLQLLLDILASFAVSAVDYIRATYQIASEVLRRLLRWILCGCTLGGQNIGGGPGIGHHRNQQYAQRAFERRHNSALNRSRCNSLPELEEFALDPSLTSEQHSMVDALLVDNLTAGTVVAHDEPSSSHSVWESWEWGILVRSKLEPAFLNESEYPADWMVYHPVLGVVPKVQAELYDQEQRKTNELKQHAKDAASRDGPADQSSFNTNGDSDLHHEARNGNDVRHEEEKKDDIAVAASSSERLEDGDTNGENGTVAIPDQRPPPQLEIFHHPSPPSTAAFRSEVVT